ncbi:unnamed protein product [Lota lota]
MPLVTLRSGAAASLIQGARQGRVPARSVATHHICHREDHTLSLRLAQASVEMEGLEWPRRRQLVTQPLGTSLNTPPPSPPPNPPHPFQRHHPETPPVISAPEQNKWIGEVNLK